MIAISMLVIVQIVEAAQRYRAAQHLEQLRLQDQMKMRMMYVNERYER